MRRKGSTAKQSQNGQTCGTARQAHFERLEDRIQLKAGESLSVVLISNAVIQAEQVAAAVVDGAIPVIYDNREMTTVALVKTLSSLSAAHDGVHIGHLAIVAHGSEGSVAIGSSSLWNLDALSTDANAFNELRSLFSGEARLDLYACSVASGSEGKAFANALAAATCTQIFASDDPVGSGPGSDLIWEYSTSIVPSGPSLLSEQGLANISNLKLAANRDDPRLFSYPVGNPLTGTGNQEDSSGWYHNYNTFGSVAGPGNATEGHLGTDMQNGPNGASLNLAVHAASPGQVVANSYWGDGNGWYVIIKHFTHAAGWDKDVYTFYGHINEAGRPAVGTFVDRGDVIGTIWDHPNGAHLHFEVRYNPVGSSFTTAGTDPGPGYAGEHFTTDTVNYFDNPSAYVNLGTTVGRKDIVWHSPETFVSANLALAPSVTNVSVDNSTPSKGQTVQVSWQTDASGVIDHLAIYLEGGSLSSSRTLKTDFVPASASGGSANVVIPSDVAAGSGYVIKVVAWNSPTNPDPRSSLTTAITINTTTSPEVTVEGNSSNIADGDTSASTSDGTDFGSVVQGGTPVSRTFTVRNDGNATLTLSGLSVPTGYSITNGLVSSLSPGSNDSFTVQLDTTSTGTKSGQISFTTNDSDENPFNFSIVGAVTAPSAPEVTVEGNGSNIADGDTSASTSDGTDFGSVLQGGTPVSRTFSVRNDGNATLTLSGLSVPTGYSISNGLVSSLSPGSNDSFTVQLDTASTGTESGQISFTTNDSDENPFNFSIVGTVNPSTGPEVTVEGNGFNIFDGDASPNSTDGTDFGTIVQNGAMISRSFTVRNDGTSTLTLSNLVCPSQFTITNPLNSQLTPGQFDTITVQFSSAKIGSFGGDVRFNTNDTDENPFNFNIEGIVVPQLGDFNRDGFRTVSDIPSMLAALTDLSAYKTSRDLLSSQLIAIGDINHDQVVNNRDIQSMLDLVASDAPGSGGSGSGTATSIEWPGQFVQAAQPQEVLGRDAESTSAAIFGQDLEFTGAVTVGQDLKPTGMATLGRNLSTAAATIGTVAIDEDLKTTSAATISPMPLVAVATPTRFALSGPPRQWSSFGALAGPVAPDTQCSSVREALIDQAIFLTPIFRGRRFHWTGDAAASDAMDSLDLSPALTPHE